VLRFLGWDSGVEQDMMTSASAIVCDSFSWHNCVGFCFRFSAYARRRYGAVDTHADNAWQLLKVPLGFIHLSFSFCFYVGCIATKPFTSVSVFPKLLISFLPFFPFFPCFHAGILLGLFFDPEDGGDVFLRNVG
jgi:hypothetical protein